MQLRKVRAAIKKIGHVPNEAPSGRQMKRDLNFQRHIAVIAHTNFQRRGASGKAMVTSLHRVLVSSKVHPDELAAIGVSCGGLLDSGRGVIQSPPNLNTWVDIPICRILMAILVGVLDPERIVVGGLALRFGESILGPARKRMMREALPGAARVCSVIPAGLGAAVGDVAALRAALEGAKRAAQSQAGEKVSVAAIEPAVASD